MKIYPNVGYLGSRKPDAEPIRNFEKIDSAPTITLTCPCCGSVSYYKLAPVLNYKVDFKFKEDNDGIHKIW